MVDLMQIHIAAICGSLRERSTTRFALRYVLHAAEELGARTSLIDLRDYDLPLADGSDYLSGDVLRLRRDVSAAQGLVIGTPVYHGSYTGVLKNAFDLMGSGELGNREWGLVGVAGGETGAVLALDHLRAIGRNLHARVIPEEVSIAKGGGKFDNHGVCTDDAIAARLGNLGRQLVRDAYLHSFVETQEFMQELELSIVN